MLHKEKSDLSSLGVPGFSKSVNPISTRGDRLCPPTLLEIPPIQISGKNFVTSVYGWKTNVSNAKCYTKVFPPDVKGLNFDVYSNYLLKSLFL